MTSIVYRVIYPNDKIYVRLDLTNSINYFGSANSALIERDFTQSERQSFSITRDVLWLSETATPGEARQVELQFILQLRANDPAIGYNRWPKRLEKFGTSEVPGDLMAPANAPAP